MVYRALTFAALVACAPTERPVPTRPALATPPPSSAQLALVATSCRPLAVERWDRDELLAIHEATTCRYRVTWLGWQPPRSYDYKPDADGFVTDYFISGGEVHADVSWNLRTNAVYVRAHAGHSLDEQRAREAASWARGTIFPGIDLNRVELRE